MCICRVSRAVLSTVKDTAFKWGRQTTIGASREGASVGASYKGGSMSKAAGGLLSSEVLFYVFYFPCINTEQKVHSFLAPYLTLYRTGHGDLQTKNSSC